MKHILITIVAAVLVVGCGKPANIFRAIDVGDIEAVKLFIAEGVDVNANNLGGETPLHFAAAYGHKEIAELLIAEGADVNAQRDNGETPLDLATIDNPKDTAETADLLRKHGGKTGEELKAADK